MNQKAKKYLWLAVRLIVSGACVAWVLNSIHLRDYQLPDGQPMRGLGHIFRDVFLLGHWPWFVLAVVVYFVCPIFCAWRWQWLLRIQNIPLRLRDAFRLTYIGFFYNAFMPGATGGDVLKAYFVTRITHHKAEAVTTVFLDRIIGMVAMALLCVGALCFKWNEAAIATPLNFLHLVNISARTIIIGFLAVSSVGGIIFFSRRLRRWFFIDRIITRLPFRELFSRLDAALFVYRYHHGALLITIVQSWGAHLFSMANVYFCALALGLHPDPVYFIIFMPVIWIISAFVPAVGGLGVIEGLCAHYFTAAVLLTSDPKEAAVLAVAMALLSRIAQFLSVLPGGVINAAHPEISAAEAERRMKESDHSDD